MTTLFNATLALADRLGVLRHSFATGGSTTTIVDTSRYEGNDEFLGGTAWIITDAGGASAAPEAEFAYISDWVLASHTFTIDTVTAAVAAGDRYGFTAARYPLDVLTNAINNEIRKYKIEKWDLTSLDIVSAQSEYDLPTGIYKHNLMGVYESTNDDADDNMWVPINYRVEQTATGTQDVLVVESQVVGVDNDIGLHYYDWHDAVYDCDDEIDDLIPLERIISAAAAHCELIRMRTYDSESKLDMEMLKYYRQEAREAASRFPVRYSSKRGNVNEAAGSLQRAARVSVPARA